MTDEQKVNEIDDKMAEERVDYSTKISSIIKLIGNIEKISEAQVLMLSYRHMLVDRITTYRAALYKKKSTDANYKKLRFEYYKTQHDLRLDYREINQFIDSDMSSRIRQTELIENQISYFQQCIETLDKLGFSIKNKIQVEEFNHKNF
jgi:hypothetical protein